MYVFKSIERLVDEAGNDLKENDEDAEGRCNDEFIPILFTYGWSVFFWCHSEKIKREVTYAFDLAAFGIKFL